MTVRFLAAAAIATAAPLLAVSPTAHAESATVVGEASCLYGGPSWMSSWTVTSASPYSVYGAGLERTHQFDELSATLEVMVNVGSSTEPRLEVVSTTISRPDGCDGTTPTPTPEPVVERIVVSEPITAPTPVVDAAPVAEPTTPRADDEDDDDGDEAHDDRSERRDRRHWAHERRDERREARRDERRSDRDDSWSRHRFHARR